MTRTFILCITAAMTPVAWTATVPHNAEYLGGTASSIPTNSIGIIDLKDAKELRFSFGKTLYRLPYRQIESYKLSGAESHTKKIAHVPVPSVLGHAQILDITYRDASGNAGMLSFRLTGKAAGSAERLLSQKIHSEEKLEAGKQPEAWWGDGYWKTNRNKDNWSESSPGAVAINAGGSK